MTSAPEEGDVDGLSHSIHKKNEVDKRLQLGKIQNLNAINSAELFFLIPLLEF